MSPAPIFTFLNLAGWGLYQGQGIFTNEFYVTSNRLLLGFVAMVTLYMMVMFGRWGAGPYSGSQTTFETKSPPQVTACFTSLSPQAHPYSCALSPPLKYLGCLCSRAYCYSSVLKSSSFPHYIKFLLSTLFTAVTIRVNCAVGN